MTRIVDLTHSVTKGDRGIDYEESMTISKNGWNARTWHLYSHSNTHMDTPKHFIDGGDTIDNTPLEVCMGPAWLIDLGEVQARQLHQIKQDTIEFIALPLKLTDGDGSPVRALARI